MIVEEGSSTWDYGKWELGVRALGVYGIVFRLKCLAYSENVWPLNPVQLWHLIFVCRLLDDVNLEPLRLSIWAP